MTKRKHPVEIFAGLESEIATYGVPPPKTWPWAINADGTTDMALRNLQLLEFVEDLRAGKISTSKVRTENIRRDLGHTVPMERFEQTPDDKLEERNNKESK